MGGSLGIGEKIGVREREDFYCRREDQHHFGQCYQGGMSAVPAYQQALPGEITAPVFSLITRVEKLSSKMVA